MQVADRIERVHEDIVNFYLVEESGRITVVDAGMAGNWGLLVDGLARIGRSLADIEAVVLTHAHSDHVGIAERIRAAAHAEARITRPTSRISSPAGDHPVAWIAASVAASSRRSPTGCARAAPDAARRRGAHLRRRRRARPARLARIVYAPGHTPGSCAIHFASRRALMTGDVLGTLDVVTGRTGPSVSPFHSDRAQAIASLARIESLEAAVVLPGHGEPFTGTPAQAAAEARARAAR